MDLYSRKVLSRRVSLKYEDTYLKSCESVRELKRKNDRTSGSTTSVDITKTMNTRHPRRCTNHSRSRRIPWRHDHG